MSVELLLLLDALHFGIHKTIIFYCRATTITALPITTTLTGGLKWNLKIRVTPATSRCYIGLWCVAWMTLA